MASRLSMASASGSGTPSIDAKEATKSTCVTSAVDTPGSIPPGQRTISGTRVPPSYTWYFPPRYGPEPSCPRSTSSLLVRTVVPST